MQAGATSIPGPSATGPVGTVDGGAGEGAASAPVASVSSAVAVGGAGASTPGLEQPRGLLPPHQHTLQDSNRWTAYWQAIMQVRVNVWFALAVTCVSWAHFPAPILAFPAVRRTPRTSRARLYWISVRVPVYCRGWRSRLARRRCVPVIHSMCKLFCFEMDPSALAPFNSRL